MAPIDGCLALKLQGQGSVTRDVVRFFNTVSPQQTGEFGMVMPTFVKQELTLAPMTVYDEVLSMVAEHLRSE